MSVMGIGSRPRAVLGSYLSGNKRAASAVGPEAGMIGNSMRRGVLQLQKAVLRHVALPGLALLIGVGVAAAQSGDARAPDQSGKPAANSAQLNDANKDNQRKTDEFVEASQ